MLICFYGIVEVFFVDIEELSVSYRIIGENNSFHVLEVTFCGVSLAPCSRSSETRFFTSRYEYADFCIFKFNTLVVESLEKRDTHIATRKIVVCAVNYNARIPHTVHCQPERYKHKTTQSEIERKSRSNIRIYAFCQHYGYYRDSGEIHKTYHRYKEVRDKGFAVDEITHRPFVSGIGMSVEENSSFDFALRMFDSRKVVRRLFGEKKIHYFEIKHKLQKHQHHTDAYQNDC